jgi:hypothetical protein
MSNPSLSKQLNNENFGAFVRKKVESKTMNIETTENKTRDLLMRLAKEIVFGYGSCKKENLK